MRQFTSKKKSVQKRFNKVLATKTEYFFNTFSDLQAFFYFMTCLVLVKLLVSILNLRNNISVYSSYALGCRTSDGTSLRRSGSGVYPFGENLHDPMMNL